MYECRWLEQCLLGSDVLSDVCLVEGDDVHGVGVTTLAGGLGCDSEPKRQIIHAVDDASLVLGRVLRDPPQTRLHHVVTVEELLFSPALHPHLVLRIGSEEVQSCDVETKLFSFGELSETCSQRYQIVTSYIGRLK